MKTKKEPKDLIPFLETLLSHQRALERGYDKLIRSIRARRMNPLYAEPYASIPIVANFKRNIEELTRLHELMDNFAPKEEGAA